MEGRVRGWDGGGMAEFERDGDTRGRKDAGINEGAQIEGDKPGMEEGMGQGRVWKVVIGMKKGGRERERKRGLDR